MNPKRYGTEEYPILADPDFDFEAYKNRYKPNSVLLDPITNISVEVTRRKETHYRSRKYSYLNVNRIPLAFAQTLEKGHPLMLTNDKETFFLEMFRTYEPAKNWQNITCKVIKPIEYAELVEKYHENVPKA